MSKTYDNWKTVTEADFVSLFIKTWFAYISTLRVMFPEAYNRRGDKKYLNAYKDYYKKIGYKNLSIDGSVMGAIEKLYSEGRKIIMSQYPEYYLWDFYHINDNFEYRFKDIPPNKMDCIVVGLKLYRVRGTSHSFTITGFIKFWGVHYKNNYTQNLRFQVSINDILTASETLVRENPMLSEQDYMAWILDNIQDQVVQTAHNEFDKLIQVEGNKRLKAKYTEIADRTYSIVRTIFALNGKDETFKTSDEMDLNRNTYELIQQRPLNYFQYHMEVEWQPHGDISAHDERYYNNLIKGLKKNSLLWFLDFVYRLRNALFHEIIDPLDTEWQLIFKNAYLILKEIVDLNIVKLKAE